MKTGVLLAQLGTPDAPTTPAVRRYLKEFLSDRRVVDLPRLLWWPILHGIILRVRPKRSAALYRKVWTEAGSPLLLHTQTQARLVAERLGTDFHVGYGMRIGNPGMFPALDAAVAAGVERLVVIPLFPQYSTATSLSVSDIVQAWQRKRPDAPPVEVYCSFPDQPTYIEALAASVRRAGVHPSGESPLVMSFHGIPQRYADRGDPYPQECEATARALAATLALPDDAWRLTYQSRFGREEWLRPYTDETLQGLARDGIREVSVIAPSFVADCLETIDEIGRELREEFEAEGGTAFTRIDCLNGDPAFADALAEVALAAIEGAGSRLRPDGEPG